MKLTEIVSDYPLKADDNLCHIDKTTEPQPKGAANQPEVETGAITDEQTTKPVSTGHEKPEQPTDHEQSRSTTAKTRSSAQPSPKREEDTTKQPLEPYNNEAPGLEGTDDSREPIHAAYVEPLCRLRWYDYGPLDCTWEPISHIQRSQTVSYKKKKLELPKNVNYASESYRLAETTFDLIISISEQSRPSRCACSRLQHLHANYRKNHCAGTN